jgi:hypothetical protein
MGTEKRSSLSIKLNPGPGHYNLNTTIGGGPKFSMSMRTSNNVDGRNNIPGPANYSPNYKSLFRNTSYTMRSRPQSSKSENYPGVGNYNLRNEKFLVVPSYK